MGISISACLNRYVFKFKLPLINKPKLLVQYPFSFLHFYTKIPFYYEPNLQFQPIITIPMNILVLIIHFIYNYYQVIK